MYGLINNDYCYLQNEHFLAKNIFKNYFKNLNLIPIINKNYCQQLSVRGVRSAKRERYVERNLR